jgi:small subunit ribosomal protein S21
LQNRDRRPRGLEVFVKNGNVDQALRKLKKKVTDDGILIDYKEKQFYEKPSAKRKKAKAASKARQKKLLKKRFEEFGF